MSSNPIPTSLNGKYKILVDDKAKDLKNFIIN